jgi:hypothetical protein
VDYIRLGRLFTVMFIAPLGLAAYVQFGVLGHAIGVVTLGEALGLAIGHLALPAIVAVPWRWVQHRRHRFSDGPGGVGILIFLLVGAAVVYGATI